MRWSITGLIRVHDAEAQGVERAGPDSLSRLTNLLSNAELELCCCLPGVGDQGDEMWFHLYMS